MMPRGRTASQAAPTTAERLSACSRYAGQAGLRVVTVLDDQYADASSRAGQGLNQLVERLSIGEFEIVVACAENGRLVTLQSAGNEASQHTLESLRCAIYARSACVNQAEPDSVADQVSSCEAFAESQGWETAMICRDSGVSGLSGSRPGLDRRMAQARAGAYDVLLVEDLDRLARRVPLLHELATELEALGVVLHTTAGPFDRGFIRRGINS